MWILKPLSQQPGTNSATDAETKTSPVPTSSAATTNAQTANVDPAQPPSLEGHEQDSVYYRDTAHDHGPIVKTNLHGSLGGQQLLVDPDALKHEFLEKLRAQAKADAQVPEENVFSPPTFCSIHEVKPVLNLSNLEQVEPDSDPKAE